MSCKRMCSTDFTLDKTMTFIKYTQPKAAWLILLPLFGLLTACAYTDSDEVAYREVIVTPANANPSVLSGRSSIDVTRTRTVTPHVAL